MEQYHQYSGQNNGTPYPPQGQAYPPTYAQGQPFAAAPGVSVPPPQPGAPATGYGAQGRQAQQPYPPQGYAPQQGAAPRQSGYVPQNTPHNSYAAGMQPAQAQPIGYYPNGYPIYPGNPYYYDPAQAQAEYEKRLKVEKAKKNLRYLGNMSGLSVILFLLFNTVVSMVLTLPGLYKMYTENAVFSAAFSIIASFIYMFVPFMIVAMLIRLRDKQVNFFPLKKMNTKRALLSIPIGLTVCIAANIIVNIIVTLFENAGVKLSQQSDAMAEPEGAFALILTLVSTAVMPALLEEFAIRGVILQPARRYGMAFAIISSSVIFGIMHGNLIQAPFAFLVGLCFAFFAIKCDSLWIGVILHFINNGFSVIMSYLGEHMKENAFNIMYYIIIGVVALAGVACFVVLLLTDKQFFKKEEGNIAGEEAKLLTKGQKFTAFFINAPMIISFIIIGLLTAQYVSK